MEKREILSDLKMVQLLITFNVDARDPVGSKNNLHTISPCM